LPVGKHAKMAGMRGPKPWATGGIPFGAGSQDVCSAQN